MTDSTLRDRWRRLRPLLSPYRASIAVLAASSFLGGAVEAAFLVVVTRTALAVADGRERLGALAGQRLSITEAVALGAGLLAARLALSLVGVRTSSTITVDVTTETRRSLADAYLRASWATQQAERSGRLHELLMSFAGQVAGIVGSVTTSITSVLNLAALLLVSVVINPVATAVVAGSLLVLGTVLSPMRRHIRARGRRAAAAQLSFAESISELGAMAMEMQAYGVRDQFAERIRELIDRDAEARRGVVVLQGSLTPVYTTLAYAALLGGIALASTLVQGELGGIAAVMLVMLRSLSYGQQAQAAAGGLGATLPYLDVIDETLARYRAEPALMGTEPISDVGDIELNEVAFAYTPGQDVLHDLSFTIAAREVVGVIGPSGSGKSTLVQLLLGVREPTAGRICLGGTPLHQVDRQALAHLVAFVGQEPLLLSGPVADSIAFYRSDIDREQVERAAERAHVAGELREMPAGFETPAGERGSRLSGGQRQRVSIARALAGRPRLLVLDEPTSALDNRSEALIRQTIAELKGSATIVIIAHRLSTLEVCDRILVLEHGHVRAFDSREALARDNSFFQEALAFSGLSG